MSRDVEGVAKGLDDAERAILLRATVKPPPAGMTWLGHGGEVFDGGIDHLAVSRCQDLGLFSAPIRRGGRGGPSTYFLNWHDLGLAVRALLLEQSK